MMYGRAGNQLYPVAYIDGCCLNNGMPDAKAGYGVYWGRNDPKNLARPLPRRPYTNNRAELYAAVGALEQAEGEGYDGVILRSDSEYTVKAMEEYIEDWRENNWRLANGGPVKNQDLIRKIDAFKQDMVVIFQHVYGHRGEECNEQADRLARIGAAKCK